MARATKRAQRIRDLLPRSSQLSASQIQSALDDGFAPPEEAAQNSARLTAYWASYEELSGRGTVANTKSLRLALPGFGGFAVQHLADALLEAWQLDPSALPQHYDAWGTDVELTEQLGAAIEHDWHENTGAVQPIDRVFRSMVASVRRRHPDHLRASASIADTAGMALGSLPLDPANLDAFPGGMAPPTPGDAWLRPSGPSPAKQVADLIEHHLDEVVTAVPFTIELVKAIVQQLHVRIAEEDVKDLAVLLAPIQAIYLRRWCVALTVIAETGTSWQVDWDNSAPEFGMIAAVALGMSGPARKRIAQMVGGSVVVPHIPPGDGTLVVDVGGGDGSSGTERLALRRQSSSVAPLEGGDPAT